ncbi:MAG: 3-phosphoglycerate dehydrogenase [Clostridiales bacterium]|jgi:D-3-phosphoglycerate dehydrogenase|nr:3-phosphoglycerate dehydrogenase [Clostridiales bacterium]
MYSILKLNEISPLANKYFDSRFNFTKECSDPEAIMLRSYNLHDYELNKSLLAIARAGAGVNNIPVDKCTKAGIVVFNTPGANANAVKELVICSLFLASRKIYEGINWVQSLKGSENVAAAVEKGKKAFAGPEIYGKKLGVIGLGAIGALVANAAVELGMTVIGYDPYITVDNAWHLSTHVIRENDLNNLYANSDYITLHIPLNSSTKYMLDVEAFSKMKRSVAIINCSRGELVNNADLIDAINKGIVSRYVTDFPTEEILGIENIITIPHLGASTPEAEDNCAVMAAKQLADFLQNGNIVNSVNFPDTTLARTSKCRLTVIHKNEQSLLSQITESISAAHINIATMVSQSQGEYAYTILELDDDLSGDVLNKLQKIEGVIRHRVIK